MCRYAGACPGSPGSVLEGEIKGGYSGMYVCMYVCVYMCVQVCGCVPRKSWIFKCGGGVLEYK